MFNEICIYEAKIEKQDEIEQLMKEGDLPVRLTRHVGKITYVLHWTVRDEETHAVLPSLVWNVFTNVGIVV